jgi:hypothetical protein
MANPNSIRFDTTLFGTDYATISSAPTSGWLLTSWSKNIHQTGAYPHTYSNLYAAEVLGSNWSVHLIMGNCASGVASAGANGVYNSNTTLYTGGGVFTGGTPLADTTGLNQSVPESDIEGWVFNAWWFYNNTGAGTIAMRQYTIFPSAPTTVVVVDQPAQAYAAYGLGVSPDAPTSIQLAIPISMQFDGTHFRVYDSLTTAPSNSTILSIAQSYGPDTTAWADWFLEHNGTSPDLTDHSGHGRNLTSAGGSLTQGLVGPLAAAVTHTTTGALTGPGATVAGTATRTDLMRFADGQAIGGNVAIGMLLQASSHTTHATSGALTGPGSTVAGTAARFRAFATSGALTGQGAILVGTAQHNIPHATSGALTGQLGSVAGTAAHVAVHATSGTLTGPGSTLAGTAVRFRTFSATGVLTGQGSAIAGTAVHNIPHATSGALTGPGSTIVGSAARANGATTHDGTGALVGQIGSVAGTAARFRAFTSTGALTGPGSTVAGSAAHIAIHGTSGTLTGQIGSVAGTAARFRAFSSTGVLTGPGATVVGAAARGVGPVTHATSGALTGPGSTVAGTAFHSNLHDTSGALTGQLGSVAGTATRFRAFSTSGALTGQLGSVAGTAFHSNLHATSGALTGPGSAVVGTAARTRVHSATGTLVGPGAIIVGAATRSGTGATYPSPSDVRLGVIYGPNGNDFTGTLVPKKLFVFDD